MRALLILFVMLLPAVVYVGYLLIRRRTDEGVEPAAAARWWRRLGFALIAGELAAAGLLAWWLFRAGEPTDLVYEPPRYEDGRLVPGQFAKPPDR